MSLRQMQVSQVSASDATFQNAVKGALHQSPKITSPATNEVDATRTPTASITDPVGADYLMAARSTTDLVLTAGQDILFNDVFSHSTMAYNPATGLFDTHNEETYSVHAHLVVTAANTDFTIDLVDSANTIIDAVRKCVVGSRTACDISFVSHAHTGARQLKLRVTAGTGNITIKTGSSLCVDEVGTEKLRTDLASVMLEWYAQGGVTPLATSAVITKTAGEWPTSVTAAGLLPSLTAVEVLAKGTSTLGFTVTPSVRQLYKTKLDKLITLSGLTGTNNLARILVGESSGAVGASFHCNGNSRKFPAAAGDGGDFRFRNSTDTADLVFYVSAVSGTIPNRVATCLVAVDAPAGIIIRGEGGPSQASRATAYLDTAFASIGGTRTQDGDAFVHTFNAGGNLVLSNWQHIVQALVVAGGAGGGSGVGGDLRGGGGGAGGFIYDPAFAVTPSTTIAVVVGAGGAAATNGNNSEFSTLIADGGGRGGSGTQTGFAGGSGGGGGAPSGSSSGYYAGGTGVTGEGKNGGTGGTDGATYRIGGGGGGASVVGAPGSASGTGGAGTSSSITGSPVYYAGGGGGGGLNTNGGTGGGGAGGLYPAGAATAGTPNKGGGGGGGADTVAGAAGGSGVVIVRYTPYINAYSSDNG